MKIPVLLCLSWLALIAAPAAPLLEQARAFDRAFQPDIRAVLRLPGPPRPAPGQVRKETDDVSAWKALLD